MNAGVRVDGARAGHLAHGVCPSLGAADIVAVSGRGALGAARLAGQQSRNRCSSLPPSA